jgi:hypothetical protein
MTPLTSPTARADRRLHSRSRAAFGTYCHLLAPDPVLGLVTDLSRSGVGVFAPRSFAVGALLPATLATVAGGAAVEVTLRVVRSQPLPTGDFALGAEFVERPLGEDELAPFVTLPADAWRTDPAHRPATACPGEANPVSRVAG